MLVADAHAFTRRHPVTACAASPPGHKASRPQKQICERTPTLKHTCKAGRRAQTRSRRNFLANVLSLHLAQTRQQRVQNLWLCCVRDPLFSGTGLAFHKHPSVCLYKLPGCAECTWELASERTLCKPACPSNSAKVVDTCV